MESLKSWAISAVVSTAVAAVVELLVPDGAYEKPVKFLISVFLLLAFVSPFAELELPDSDYDGVENFIQSHELEKAVEQQAEEALSSQVESSISAFAKSIGAVCHSVEAEIEITAEQDIFVKSITVRLEQENGDIRRHLTVYSKENFGVEPYYEALK